MHIPHHNPKSQLAHVRQGSAPLEFVMALPVLLLLFSLILSVGVFFLGQVKATINARSKAFQQRSGQKSSRPLAFTGQTSKQDVYTADATETPAYPSPKINFGAVTARQSVLGGAWDHRELLRGNGPHWKDMEKASVGGATNQIGSLLDQFANGFDPSMIPGIEDAAGGLLGQLLGESGSANDQFGQMQQEQQQRNQENIQQLQTEIDALKAERTGLQNEINNDLIPKRNELNERIKQRQAQIDSEKDPEKKKDLQKQQDADKESLKQTNQQIKQKQDRIQEIDNEIKVKQGLMDRLKKF